MRFTEQDPAIPDELVHAQERGEAVFLCGAGVSMTAGLPSFRTLVEGVYESLGDDWRVHAAEREAMSPKGCMAGQYDRALRCLERRLEANDVRSAGGLRDRIRAAIDAQLAFPPDADLPNHLALLQLSTGRDGVSRLATTNFDTGFERAWAASRGSRIQSHAGSAMPQPGSAGFEGVLHLHGRCADAELELPPTNLVLNSAEFGEAYLRSGWASRYVYDLARSHTMVLVGYQADDPPMRYVLEVLEADRSRFADLRKVYSFAPASPGKEELEAALWAAKGITALIYASTEAAEHDGLYRTLTAWRNYASSPPAWRERRLRVLLSDEPRGNAQADEAASLLSHGNGPALVARLSPAPSWWPILSRDDRLSSHPDFLATWLFARGNDPDMLRACVADPPASPSVFERVLWLAGQDKGMSSDNARGWRLLAAASREADRGGHAQRWYAYRERISRGDIDREVRIAAVEALRPRLRVEQPFAWPRQSASDDARRLRSTMRVEFGTRGYQSAAEVLAAFPDDPDETLRLLRIADRALEDSLEDAEEAGHMDGFDHASQDVRSFHGPSRLGAENGFAPLARLVAGLWERLAAADPTGAARILSTWAGSPHALRRRLHLDASLRGDIVDGRDVGTTLIGLDSRDFWVGELDREVARLLAARWNDLGGRARNRIEKRIAAGVPSSLFRSDFDRNDAAGRAVRDRLVFRRLEPIRRAGGSLSPRLSALLATIEARNPPDALTEPDDDGSGPRRVSWVSRTDVTQFLAVPDEALVETVLSAMERDPFGLGEAWRAICTSEPMRALRATRFALLSGTRLDAILVPLLSTASEVDPATFDKCVLELVAGLPLAGISSGIAAAAAHFIRETAGRAPAGAVMPEAMLSVWDKVADAVLDGGAILDDGVISPVTVDEALNSPGGLLAWALLAWIGQSTWFAGEGLGPAYLARIDRLATGTRLAGRQARVLLVRDLAFLHDVEPAWTIRVLVPFLAWDNSEALSLWRARAGGRIGKAELFNALKPAFLEAVSRANGRDEGTDRLAINLVQVASWKLDPAAADYDLTWPEMKTALSRAPVEVRRSASWALWRMVAGEEDGAVGCAGRWRDRVGPLVGRLWPLDAAARDQQASRNLAFMALQCGTAFPNAVDTIADLIVPFEIVRIEDLLQHCHDADAILAESAAAFLRLLDRLLGSRLERLPTDLGAMMGRLGSNDPKVADDPIYHRLNALAQRA